MTDSFRELKKLVDPGFDGMLPCVEVGKGIICGDFGKFEKTSTVKRFSFRGATPPKQFGTSRAHLIATSREEAGGPFVNATTPRSSYHLF